MYQGARLSGVRLQCGAGTQLRRLRQHPLLGLAGFRVQLDLPNEACWAALSERVGHFSVSGAATSHLRVVLAEPSAGVPGGDPRVFQDEQGLHLQHDQYHGWVEPDGCATLVVGGAATNCPDPTFGMAVDGLLRVQLAQLLQNAAGLMLHAAGIRGPHERGYVFFGPSGSGKTTMCRISSPQYDILCDELIAIRLDQGQPMLHSTPFSGAWGRSEAGAVPLRGLYRLRHAPRTHLRKLTPNHAVREILESLVCYDQSPKSLAASLDITGNLVQAVPAHELAFQPEETVWQTITTQTSRCAGSSSILASQREPSTVKP